MLNDLDQRDLPTCQHDSVGGSAAAYQYVALGSACTTYASQRSSLNTESGGVEMWLPVCMYCVAGCGAMYEGDALRMYGGMRFARCDQLKRIEVPNSLI
jgi:hypothetical protein